MFRDYRIKSYEPCRWYHVWNRGACRRAIFGDDADKRAFLDGFSRHLGRSPAFDQRGRRYRHLRDEIELGAFCLMPNHFHLLIRTGDDPLRLPDLVRRLKSSYALHHRRRYGSTGRLFDGAYQADVIQTPSRLLRAATYIHLNFENDPAYNFSSHGHFIAEQRPDWLNGAASLMTAIGGNAAYERHLALTIDGREAARDRRRRLAELDTEALDLRRGIP